MRALQFLFVTAVIGFGAAATSHSQAQVGAGTPVPPDCAYGYFDVLPYDCAPAGYYGPEWFNGEVFIGAGPWFLGDHDFHGYVDNHFDRDHGYTGSIPEDREHHRAKSSPANSHFHGNEIRDGRGHVIGERS